MENVGLLNNFLTQTKSLNLFVHDYQIRSKIGLFLSRDAILC